MATLYTLGYEKLSLDAFLEILKAARIDVLIDVRDGAWSHKRGFSKSALSAAVNETGMEYIHAQFVGNPKRLRAEGGTTEALLERYAHHLDADPSIEARFDELLADRMAGDRRVCLLCFERDPAECHRGVLTERWRRRHARPVEHIKPREDSLATPSFL